MWTFYNYEDGRNEIDDFIMCFGCWVVETAHDSFWCYTFFLHAEVYWWAMRQLARFGGRVILSGLGRSHSQQRIGK
jgi:hypothetical protein